MHARGLERIDDAERSIEPAGMVLAFEMRAREQLWAGLRAGAEHIADAVDLAVRPASGNRAASHSSDRIWASEKVGLCTPVL